MAVRNFLDKDGLELYDELIKQKINSIKTSNFTAEDREKFDGISEEANKVSYAQTLTSGTKIGELSIDDNSPINLYAPTPPSESDIVGMGFTKNTGTITGISMNGASVGTSGNVNLGTVITAHQDISGKQNASTAVKYGGNAAVGSSVKGVYIDSAGNATAMTYELNKTVPADAEFTDTTYENKTAVSGGTDVSLVTTGEKYTWNNKIDKNGTDSLMTAEEHTKLAGIGTAAFKDVASSGDALSSQVVMGNDSRLTDSRNAKDVSAWAKASTKPTYTASEVGAIATSAKGSANGVAELDSTGKVPSSQLPSYVDDVIEGYYYNSKFYKESAHTTEISGEAGKIYTDLSTDKTYRWSGTAFVQIKGDLALGETSTTAYRGDRGKIAYDHSQSTHARTDATKVEASSTNGNIKINGTETTVYTHPGSGTNPHGTTKSDVGLGNVGNFKAVSTVSSQGLTDTEKANARANIGAGTGNGTITGITMNGASKGTSGVVDLGTVLTSHQNISGKADKSATVSTVVWDSTNKKITKTINGTTSDVVTAATILGNLTKSQVTTALGYTPPTTDNDTKNTAGSTDTSSKIFLIGATSQAANPQTYSHDTAYVGTDGCLYSGGSKVLTAHQDISGKVSKSGDTMTGALNFANAIANKAGDDVQIGDHNKPGSLGVQGINGDTAITLLKRGATWSANSEGCSLIYNSTNKCLDFVFA